MIWRLAAAVVLCGAGFVAAVAATLVHQQWWGLLLAAATGLGGVLALPARWWTRLAYAAGWAGTVGWLTLPRTEGDYLIPSDASGYTLLILALVVLLAALVTLPPPRRSE